ncbi:MAG: DUF1549 domain-containing protein, partial [Acidobacteriota bacterium]
MKRIALFFFIFIAAILMTLPAVRPQAAQRGMQRDTVAPNGPALRTRAATIRERKIRDPHAGISYQQDLVGEVSRATRDVAAVLPAPPFTQPAYRPALGTRAEEFDNLIDREIFGTMTARGIESAALASDEEFCRRIFLDITGRQPNPERLLKYINDPDPQKKDKLITELITSSEYVDRWTNWMGDLVRS